MLHLRTFNNTLNVEPNSYHFKFDLNKVLNSPSNYLATIITPIIRSSAVLSKSFGAQPDR